MSKEEKINDLLGSALSGFKESGSGLKRAGDDLSKGNIVGGLIGGTGSAIEGLMNIPLAGAGLVVEALSLSAGVMAKAGNKVLSIAGKDTKPDAIKPDHLGGTSSPASSPPPPEHIPVVRSSPSLAQNTLSEEQYLNYKEMKEIARSSGFKSVSELVNKLGVTYAELDGKKGATSGDLFVVNPSLAALQNKEGKVR